MEQEYFDKLAAAIIEGEEEECLQLIRDGLDQGVNPLEAIEKGLSKGITSVGDDFSKGILFLPELIMAADIMKKATELLDEAIKSSGLERESRGKIVIGTVKGDIHDIGKSVVASVLQSSGFDVVDIGIDISVETFIDSARKHSAQVLGMSSLLTLPMQVMGEVIQKVKDEGLSSSIKTIVGGCPVTQEFADEIHADAVGFDAADAVKKINILLNN